MEQEELTISVGAAVGLSIFDDATMVGSTSKWSPIVEYPDDRVGPMQGELNILFYICAPCNSGAHSPVCS